MTRKAVPTKVETEVLSKSRRRCALCYGINRFQEAVTGQIAHIDRNSSNSSFDNLVFLCLEHHDKYDSTSRQSKNYTQNELKKYRDELYSDLEKSLSVPSNFFTSATYDNDEYSGKFLHTTENRESTIEIKHISGNKYVIDGISLYGTKHPGGPNIGELCEIGTLDSNILTFSDINNNGYNDEKYTITITFYGETIDVEDTYSSFRFGAGVSFSGKYVKI